MFKAIACDPLAWNRSLLPNGEPKGIEYKIIMDGEGGSPMIILARYEPGWVEPRHRHAEDETLFLVEGEIEVEGELHQAPSVVFVSRGTLYGPLTAGPNGVVFYRIGYNQRRPLAASA
jgi:hypothetical protein